MTTLNPNSNPDPLAPFEVKKQNEYGLQIANVISREWFSGGVISKGCEFYSRRDYIVLNRKFVRAEQDEALYKNHQKRGDNDLDYLNLDWTILNLVAKFCNNVSNGIKDDYYRLDIKPMDPISIKMKAEKESQYRRDMVAMPMLQKTKQTLGLDLVPKGFVPEDEDELKLWMEIKERSKIAIGEEILINYIKETNGWKNFQSKKNKDLVNIGMSGARIYTDKNNGVMFKYVNSENYVHSYVEENDFSDAHYHGVVDTVTISDLKRESGFSDAVLRNILKNYSSSGRYSITNLNSCEMNDLLGHKVDVLRFAYKTHKTEVYKKSVRKGKVVKVSKKDESYDSQMKTSRTLDTWMEGNHIIGTNYIYGYKECENLARDKMNMAISPFQMRATDIYQNRLRSFLDDLKPIAKQMQNLWLKLQNLSAELKPDRTVINVNALADITGSGDKQKNWKEVLSLLNVKNIILEQTIDMGDEGGVQRVQGARTEAQSQGSSLTVAMNRFASLYNLMYDISGINQAAAGSLPSDALVGVSEMNKLASNTNTQHIVEASVDLDLRISQCISTRIGEIFKAKDAKHITDLYKQAVGRSSIEAREAIGDRHLYEFGFVFEMLPSSEEIKDFKDDLTIGMNEGTIDADVKIEATRIAKVNIKLATEYLSYMRKKKIKQKQAENERNIMLQGKVNQESAQAKAQSDALIIQAKAQADLGSYGQKAQIDIMTAQALQEIANPVEQKEFEREVYLERIKTMSKVSMEDFKESRKDDRTRLQAGQQSKLINQRQKDTAPIDFEAEENWMMQ